MTDSMFMGSLEEESRNIAIIRDWLYRPESCKLIVKRSLIIQSVRNHLIRKGFLEVDTPSILTSPGQVSEKLEASDYPRLDQVPNVMHSSGCFEVTSRAGSRVFYLRTSPETYLKRYLVGGFKKVFTIGSAFRNEKEDSQHLPEFKIVEWEEVKSSSEAQMKMVENLVASVAQQCVGSSKVYRNNVSVEFMPPWRRICLLDALNNLAGLDVSRMDCVTVQGVAARHGVLNAYKLSWGLCVVSLFELLVQPRLVEPTFIFGYPREICPLALPQQTDPRLSDRFELYVFGLELGNAYANQTVPSLVRDQCLNTALAAGFTKSEVNCDEGLLRALDEGIPSSYGCAIGLDRLIMILCQAEQIGDVAPFF